MTRPNILLIQADQLAGPAMPMNGNTIVQSPHVSRMAEEGVTFLNAYCNNPVCGPSRASMLTGQMSSTVGNFDNGGEFLSSHPTFAHYLRFLGYRTCLSGKMHFVGGDQLHGFEERVTTDVYPSDYGWAADWSQQEEPYSPSRMSMINITDAGVCARGLQIDYDEDVCYQAVQTLYDYARSTDERPFMMTVSFTHPHNPFVTQQEFWDLYDHDAINMPSVPHIPVEERDPWSQRYYYTIRQDEHEVTDEHIRTSRHAYYGMISYLDSLVGRILKALDDCGYSDNTYVIFTSDHGEMLGERGMWFKFNPYEWSVKVPMVITGPGMRQGATVSNGVSLLDFLPTFLDIAAPGQWPELAEPIDGVSLMEQLTSDAVREDDIMMEYTGEGTYAPCMMLRKDGFKYVHCRTDPPMMFDLENDPGEVTNLAQDPAHAGRAAAMKAEIERRWDYDGIEARVIQSQKRRLFVQQALLKGEWTGWDFQPFVDATKAYVRGAVDPSTVLTKARKRYPFVAPKPADTPRTLPLAVDLKPKG